MIDPGRFTEPCAVQAVVRERTAGGGYTEEWADIAEWSHVYFEMMPLRGFEQLTGMQLSASANYRLRGWALEGLRSTDHRIRRLRDGGIMEIIAPPSFAPDRLSMDLIVHEVEAAEA